ncbi:MAG: hypothetical protein LUF29_08695 [Oscillospiraceae bacterium]|nr:hypothetical protein [Oscillospiraceae bacterium]
MAMKSEKLYKRAGIYIAPSAYGLPVDLEEALASCKAFIRKNRELKLMRIYWDDEVTVVRTSEQNGRRTPLGVTGNDAWQRLLRDTETSAIEVIVIYAARTVAPSISGLARLIREYFLPCGIRLIDVEAGFDSETGDVEDYLKHRNREYRSTLYGRKAAE